MICKTLIGFLVPTFLQVISLQTLVQSIMAATGVYTPGVESRDGFKCQGPNEMTNSFEASYNV